MLFPFSEFIEFKNKKISSKNVIEKIIGQVTLERQNKVAQVVQERNFSVIPVLEDIYDRGNISAVLRSAEAFSFANIHIIEKGEKFKNSDRVSQGADKWLEISKWSDSASCLSDLKKNGCKILVTDLAAKNSIYDIPIDGPVAVLFGNEKFGASDEARSVADHCIRIPMGGFVQSFNISVAAALCFQYLFFQFQDKKHLFSMSELQKTRLIAEYYLRSVKNPECYFS